jgi:hypothetical protein
MDILASDPDINLDTRDESDKFTSLGDSNSDVPIRFISRSSQCPTHQLLQIYTTLDIPKKELF